MRVLGKEEEGRVEAGGWFEREEEVVGREEGEGREKEVEGREDGGEGMESPLGLLLFMETTHASSCPVGRRDGMSRCCSSNNRSTSNFCIILIRSLMNGLVVLSVKILSMSWTSIKPEYDQKCVK